MHQWTLRRATPDDAPALIACITAAYSAFAGAIPDLPDVTEGVADDIADRHVWVADKGPDIAGGIVLHIAPPLAHLMNLAVDPRRQGQGLARSLIETAERAARDSGCTKLDLATHVLMPDNLAYYQRLGWAEAGREGNKVLMSKPL